MDMSGYRPLLAPGMIPVAHQNRQNAMYHTITRNHGVVYPSHGGLHNLNLHGQLHHHHHHNLMSSARLPHQQQQPSHHQRYHSQHVSSLHSNQQLHIGSGGGINGSGNVPSSGMGLGTPGVPANHMGSRQMMSHMQTSIVPLNANGEPIKLPDNLESLPRADNFPTQRHRWNTNEEIAAILISFDKHSEWQSKEVRTRPKSGSMLLYSRKKVRYRRDGYCWKKRKDGKTTREDHMKLKVQGTECIYGCYVHSAILPTFHRRCYWLLQNPDIVLVHYLNVPYPDDNKMAVITPNLALWGDKKEWTKEELVSQLKPMFFSEDEPDASNDIEISTAETVEAIVSQLMEKQRLARQAALVKQLECGCPDSTCVDGKSCSHPTRRTTTVKTCNDRRQESSNQVSSTTPNVLVGPRVYSRWFDRRGRDPMTELTAKTSQGPINFQVIPQIQNQSNLSNNYHHQQQTSQQLERQHNATLINQSTKMLPAATTTSVTTAHNSTSTSVNSHMFVNSPNSNNQINRIITENTVTQMVINTRHSNNTRTNGVCTSVSKTISNCSSDNTPNNQPNSHSNQAISLTISNENNNLNNSTNNDGSHPQYPSITASPSSSIRLNQQHHQQLHPQQQQQQSTQHLQHHRQQPQQYHHQSMIESNVVNHRLPSNPGNRTTNGRLSINSSNGNTSTNKIIKENAAGSSAPPLVLNLTQLQGSSTGGLLILNGQQNPFVHQQRKLCNTKNEIQSQTISPNLVPKEEAMDSSMTPTSNGDINSMYCSMNYERGTDPAPIDSPSKETDSIVKEFNDSLPFFNETLDLSHEDIQKTLSANMPLSGHCNTNVTDDDINPMEFIDNVCDVNGNACADNCANDNNHDPDDVFVNLDAFDMLVEFPELDMDPKHTFPNDATHKVTSRQHQKEKESNHNSRESMTRNESLIHETLNITEYSPEWAYPEGGIKVLVVGPWSSTSSYTVLFDSFPVPTTVVQSGVLRCYCPAHEVGLASLQVACDGYVISNTVIFEYKSPPNLETVSEGTLNDSLYKFSLLNRLSSIDDRMQIKSEIKDLPEESALLLQQNFEERLVNYCQLLTNKTWRNLNSTSWPKGLYGMTLLHLASILGYTKLVCTMLTWRTENPNVVLETEIDALSQDVQGYTPLSWACFRGHLETALILYKWNYNAMNIKNCLQQTPLDIAKIKGFTNITTEFERLEGERLNGQIHLNLSMAHQTFISDHSSASSQNESYQTENKVHESIKNDNKGDENALSCSTNKASDLMKTSNLTFPHHDKFTGSNSVDQSQNSGNGNKLTNSYDQQFPKSLINSRQEKQKHHLPTNFNATVMVNNNIENGSCVANTTNNQINVIKDNETNSTINLSNEKLSSQCSSPASTSSSISMNSNKSHDGVFLRPIAISSGQSPPGMRFSKRSSMDSGINMDTRVSYSRSGKLLREQQKYHSLDTSDNNSSLSIDSVMDGITGSGSTTSNILLSPLRKMDFALCEVSAAESSPIQDKHQGSTSDDEDIEDQSNMPDNGVVVGESNAKVLTLAEHIIAAMPERIKYESEEIMSLGSPISDSLNTDASGMGGLNEGFMEPILDSLSSTQFEQEYNFEFSDHSYRYHEVGTPCSSLSPASSGPLQSPASYSIAPDPPMTSPSPPPSAQDFTEFLQASNSIQRPFETDFSNLTLTDREQRELYEAAKCIQKAYRSYKGRKKLEEQDKERSAAIVIQNYYRRYKQFAYYRQMTHAALVIQNGYRSYCENKRFKKSLDPNQHRQENYDSQCLQQYYNYFHNDQAQQEQQNSEQQQAEQSKHHGELKQEQQQQQQQLMHQQKREEQKQKAQQQQQLHQQHEKQQQQQKQQQQEQQQQSQQQQQMQGIDCTSKDPNSSGPLKRTYSQRTQNQAARKIQQFMRQSKMKLQRERAEKERQAHQRRGEFLQNWQFRDQLEVGHSQDQNET